MDQNLKIKTTVWALTISPLVWALHFMLAYVASAIVCAKDPEKLNSARNFTGVLTILAILLLLREITYAWSRHRLGESPPPHDQSTHFDRERFLGLARLLISSLSLLAVGYTTYAVYFFRSCR